MEQTLVLVKPDGVQRGLTGEIIGRLERRGLKLAAMKTDAGGRCAGASSLRRTR